MDAARSAAAKKAWASRRSHSRSMGRGEFGRAGGHAAHEAPPAAPGVRTASRPRASMTHYKSGLPKQGGPAAKRTHAALEERGWKFDSKREKAPALDKKSPEARQKRGALAQKKLEARKQWSRQNPIK